tara:strand:- start:169 stop:741 length:573 start_codon:yes stop_codon:yes gene_type:complete
MQPSGSNNGREGAESPFENETHVRILEVMQRRPTGYEIHGLSNPGLYIVRARISDGSSCKAGDCIGTRDGIIGPQSHLRHRDLSSDSSSSLIDVIKESITNNPDQHLNFFNRANSISLKMHAFQLLPGVGKSTAQDWVKKRGPNGWFDLEDVSKKLDVDAPLLLAERYEMEIKDPSESPSLLELLVRSQP